VEGLDAFWQMKKRGLDQRRERQYDAIELPRNSPTGFVTAFFAVVMGFALIWHIWWAVVLGAIGAFATFMAFAWRKRDEYELPAEEIARIERARAGAVAA
jgi:cytochrome o ubiquinol oxidase subunit 1